jgi:hypothetical protein
MTDNKGAVTPGLTKQQIIDNRANINDRQNTLFKSGGDYTCPTTYSNSTQNNVMNQVCQSNANTNNVKSGIGGKLKRKTKRRKTKRRKIKKKSKRRK